MGHSRYDAGMYAGYARSTSTKTHNDYTSRSLKAEFDPVKITVRESRKGDLNPNPTPIIVGLDASGSMGRVVEACRKGLGVLFEQIIDRQPVTDPHVMAMIVGDMECDSAPVQATQFEADPVTVGKQIEDLYLERGGGGNNHESYLGPLYFALTKTNCDAFADDRKGYLFTVGDECIQEQLLKSHITRFFGDEGGRDMTAEELVASVGRNWEYFHLMVEEGDYMKHARRRVVDSWSGLLGQRAIPLADHTKLAQVIISLIEVTNGRDKDEVVKSWSASPGTDLVVAKAIGELTAGVGHNGGPVAL
jgi:hypothetical protein